MHRFRWAASCGLVAVLCSAIPLASATAAEYSVALHPGESVVLSAASGTYGYTLELISPTVQVKAPIDFFSGPYFYSLLTNTAPVTDTFHLAVRDLVVTPPQSPWFPQVCLRATCYPDSTDLVFDSGTADTIGVQVVPFDNGVGEWDFYVNSVGDPGLNDTIHMTLYAGTFAVGAPEVAASGGLELRQNVPNPVVDRTAISFTLPRQEHVSLGVFDVAGRLVADLDSGVLPAGPHTVHWDGRSSDGGAVPAGVYFYRLRTPAGELSRRMTLVR